MNSLKVILAGILCASLLTACGCSANENHENTTSTDEPTEYVTDRPHNNDNNTTAGDAAGNVVDDAGNVVEDAGDAVNDAVDGVGNAMRD